MFRTRRHSIDEDLRARFLQDGESVLSLSNIMSDKTSWSRLARAASGRSEEASYAAYDSSVVRRWSARATCNYFMACLHSFGDLSATLLRLHTTDIRSTHLLDPCGSYLAYFDLRRRNTWFTEPTAHSQGHST